MPSNGRQARIVAIVVNYRLAEQALQAAASIASQDADADIRLVDNSQCPRQAQTLRGGPWPVLVNAENLGFGQACNAVYAQTASPYVLLLNPDARLLPGALQRLADYLDRHGEVAAVAPRAYWDAGRRLRLPPNRLPGGGLPALLALPGALGEGLRRRWCLAWRRHALRYWLAEGALTQPALSGGHVLLRRGAVDAAGGLFDPRFFLYWEDTDLFYRLRRGGARAVLLPDAEAVHPAGACARADGVPTADWARRSQALYWDKHYPWSAVLTRLAQRLPGTDRAAHPAPIETVAAGTPLPIQVPAPWHRHWCLELAAEPLFLWPYALLGTGPRIDLPAEARDCLPAGGYARLGPTGHSRLPPRVWRLLPQPRLGDTRKPETSNCPQMNANERK